VQDPASTFTKKKFRETLPLTPVTGRAIPRAIFSIPSMLSDPQYIHFYSHKLHLQNKKLKKTEEIERYCADRISVNRLQLTTQSALPLHERSLYNAYTGWVKKAVVL